MLRFTGYVLLCAIFLVSCNHEKQPATFQAVVKPGLKPVQGSMPSSKGAIQSIAASRDAHGVQSDFMEGVVVLKPRTDTDLQTFLQRYSGVVVHTNALPALPPSWNVKLTEQDRKPTTFVVRVDLARVDLLRLPANARLAGIHETLEFSSDAGLKTFAVALDARAAGFRALGNFIDEPHQSFPQVTFSTRERPTGAPGSGTFDDAFLEPHYGAPANVALSWQFLSAHGIQRRVKVAIIDRGFWLDAAGQALGTDSDFPLPPAKPIQFDLVDGDTAAGGPNPSACSNGTPCAWHGNNSAGVAIGIVNNSLGAAGTGGIIGDPILLRYDGSSDSRHNAVSMAVRMGADVVSMSVGGSCDVWCRIGDREDTPISDAVDGGSRTVFVASAGNSQDDVGDPHFVHPCIEDHVICVGALSDSPIATTIASYSNFGAGVDIFAPSNIKVMSTPPPTDQTGTLPATPQTHGGTSASTPFVAGVAAMMKAINPNLSSDDVSQILFATSTPGIGQATHIIDALAALRRAADGIPMVPDRFEPNSLETTPANLGAVPPYNQANLNIDKHDRDFFKFVSPGASTATITLNFPPAIANVSVFDLQGAGGTCSLPVPLGSTPLSSPPGQSYSYRLAGGPHLLQLAGDGINAYNLGISFVTAALSPDGSEPNDTVPQARYIYSLVPSSMGGLGTVALSIDPRVTIEANLHTNTDVDYYILRGSTANLAERVLLGANPAVMLYGNDSSVNLKVFKLNPGKTQGALVADIGGDSCVAKMLSVPLDSDALYLARVSGTTGNYVLRNAISTNPRRWPILVHDPIYQVLHPGEPVEHGLNFSEVYVLTVDPSYSGVRSTGPRVHLTLLDAQRNVVAEGSADQSGEFVRFPESRANAPYQLKVTRRDHEIQPPNLALRWEPAQASRTSPNLIQNPGAEFSGANNPSEIANWSASSGPLAPSVRSYGQDAGISPNDPGPQDRGKLFFSGPGRAGRSELRQSVSIDPAWRTAINRGAVKADFSAFLGGISKDRGSVRATVTYLDANQRSVGSLMLTSVTFMERESKTALMGAAAAAFLPANTTTLRVELLFTRFDGDSSGPSADNLELKLSEYGH